MNLWMGLTAALFLASVYSILFVLLVRPYAKAIGPAADPPDKDKRPLLPRVVWLFVLCFLFLWSGSLWIAPVGPVWWGISWVPLFYLGLMTLLLALAFSSGLGGQVQSDLRSSRAASSSNGTLVLLWALIGLLAVAILIGILSPPNLMV